VVWREEKCMGCRFCMVSCPFNGPKFEYSSANPRIRKCVMCADRVRAGKEPACVENCPEGALTFGKRADLIRIGRKRIAENPEQYVDHIYGEREVGGTSWLYLAGVPFEEMDSRATWGRPPTRPHASFLYSVPMVLTLAPALMLGWRGRGARGRRGMSARGGGVGIGSSRGGGRSWAAPARYESGGGAWAVPAG
jgi:NAD-dependent dihydropyrimidine dehydrogenase PreA subunit